MSNGIVKTGLAGRIAVVALSAAVLAIGLLGGGNAGASNQVDVVVQLVDGSGLAAWQQRRTLSREAAGISARGRRGFEARERVRENAIESLNERAQEAAAPAQARLAGAIERLGGEVTGALPAPSVIYARIDSEKVDELRDVEGVAGVTIEGERTYTGVPEISGADVWHAAGCTGAGASDTCPATSAPQSATGPANSPDGQGGPDIAVDDQGVNCHHDAFTGGPTPALGRTPAVARPSWAIPCGSTTSDNGSLHGNTIAAVIAVKDPVHRGAAYGIDKIFDPAPMCSTGALWLLGITFNGWVGPGCDGQTRPGLTDLPEAWNKSWFSLSVGSPENTSDDSTVSREADMEAAQYGIAQAPGAGNGGPYAPQSATLRTCFDDPNNVLCQYRVQQPCVAYNSVCMGAGSSVVETFSSRGPSVGGRKKPDLVSYDGTGAGCPRGSYTGNKLNPPEPQFPSLDPPYGLVPADSNWAAGSICGRGTSYSAPYGAAAQLLLSGIGVTAPFAQKAILVNSATSITSERTGGIQTYWAPDVGWGELDLAQAYADRGNFRTAQVDGSPINNARFFRVNGQSAGDRTTLVWHRRATSVMAGSLVTTAYTDSNLDLYQLTLAGADNDADVCGGSTTCGVDASESTDTGPRVTVSGVVQQWEAATDNSDNVEQVRAAAGGDSIMKVRANSAVDGQQREDFALASTEAVVQLSTPTITTPAPTLGASSAGIGQNVTVSASATNDSTGTDLVSGLDLASSQLSINLPAGVTLISGSATQALGSLNTGQTKNANWTVAASSEAIHQITVSASGQRFGESFGGESSPASLTVDQTAPSISLGGPSGWQGSASNAVNWTASDNVSGVANVAVEASIDGGAFTTIYDGANATGTADVSAADGQSVTVRATAEDGNGNVSAQQSATWMVDADPPTLSVSAPARVFAGDATAVDVAAANIGTPVSVTYQINGGTVSPLSGSRIALAPRARTQVSVTATDGLSRSVTKSVAIDTRKRASSVRAKVVKRGRAKQLRVTTASGASGTARVSVKCAKKRLRVTVRVSSGSGRAKLRARLGRCRISVSFTPADAALFEASSVRTNARL